MQNDRQLTAVNLPVRDSVYRSVATDEYVKTLPEWAAHKVLMRFAPGIEHYERRLTHLGLCGKDIVLDAGCGYGQWSVALWRQNRKVIALDHSDRFLRIAKSVLRHHTPERCLLVKGDVHRLPLPDASVDAILSAEVLFYTDEIAVLREFYRVLKPSGKVYILTAGLGYHLEYVLENWYRPGGLKHWLAYVGRTVLSRFPGTRSRSEVEFLTKRGLNRLLRKAGFTVTAIGPEGTVPNGQPPLRLRRGRFLGCFSWLEVLALKSGHGFSANGVAVDALRKRAPAGRSLDAVVGLTALALVFPIIVILTILNRERSHGRPELITTVMKEITFLPE